jgi:hypothetical protein
MKSIKNIVTDLETSKALQKAGIKYDTVWVWIYTTDESPASLVTIERFNELKEHSDFDNKKGFFRFCNAFTAGEMMQVLPFRMHAYTDYLGDKHFTNLCLIKRLGVKYIAGYGKRSPSQTLPVVQTRGVFMKRKILSAIASLVINIILVFVFSFLHSLVLKKYLSFEQVFLGYISAFFIYHFINIVRLVEKE